MRLIIALTALSFAAAASAQDRPGRMLSDSCRGELMKLCAASGGDRAARRQCIMSNRDKISDTCKGELRAAMEKRRAAGGGRRGLGGDGDMSAPGAMTTEQPPK